MRSRKDVIRDADFIPYQLNSSTTLLISSYLTSDDIKCIRETSKHILLNVRYTLQDYKISGPYSNSIQLLLTSSNYFEENENSLTRVSFETQFENGWKFYNICIQNNITKPAFLYKMRDSLLFSTGLYDIDGDYAIKENGRKYPADNYVHTWETNLAWMLGHIHQCHEFLVVSPLLDEYIIRPMKLGVYEYQPSGKYSAFAKEITVAIKAEYKVSNVIETHNAHKIRYLQLTPTLSKFHACQFSMKDINPTKEDVRLAIQRVKDEEKAILKSRKKCTIL